MLYLWDKKVDPKLKIFKKWLKRWRSFQKLHQNIILLGRLSLAAYFCDLLYKCLSDIWMQIWAPEALKRWNYEAIWWKVKHFITSTLLPPIKASSLYWISFKPALNASLVHWINFKAVSNVLSVNRFRNCLSCLNAMKKKMLKQVTVEAIIHFYYRYSYVCVGSFWLVSDPELSRCQTYKILTLSDIKLIR